MVSTLEKDAALRWRAERETRARPREVPTICGQNWAREISEGPRSRAYYVEIAVHFRSLIFWPHFPLASTNETWESSLLG